MRLLSFLNEVEKALRAVEVIESREPCARFVDYTNSTARMMLEEDRSVVVRLYRLASGRVCMRVFYERDGDSIPVKTLYPEVDSFSWAVGVYEVQKALEAVFEDEAAALAAASSQEEDVLPAARAASA